jgi:hypothetical protein
MTKVIEYRVIPIPGWAVVRFEKAHVGVASSIGSTRRGEFQNEGEAEEVAKRLAKSEDGASFISRSSMNKVVTSGPIAGGGLSSS